MKTLLSLVFFSLTCILCLYAEMKTFADAQLEKIAVDHHTLLQNIKNVSYSEQELSRQSDAVLKDYENFITHNPNFADAYLLYGKLLRTIGEKTLAHAAFIKANKIDPNMPVAKQQIANYLTETGNYSLALAYMLQAAELSPNEAQYHYQLGEILYTYKDTFIQEKILTPESFDNQMLTAFEKAKNLKPEERVLGLRYAEAFYDLCIPQWEQALSEWEKLKQSAPNQLAEQITDLHKARILIILNKIEDAKQCLNQITDSKLQSLKTTIELDLFNNQSNEETTVIFNTQS